MCGLLRLLSVKERLGSVNNPFELAFKSRSLFAAEATLTLSQALTLAEKQEMYLRRVVEL
jgi:hypothetical protein